MTEKVSRKKSSISEIVKMKLSGFRLITYEWRDIFKIGKSCIFTVKLKNMNEVVSFVKLEGDQNSRCNLMTKLIK